MLNVFLVIIFTSSFIFSADFTGTPTVQQSGDSLKIQFKVTEFTDVGISVLDTQGQVLKTLTSGLLGANAPSPFQKDSTSQTIYWDWKDNHGNPVPKSTQVVVNIGLGLNPEFDFNFGWTGQRYGNVHGIETDNTGNLYVTYTREITEHGPMCFIKVFDRDGKYIRTILPLSNNVSSTGLNMLVLKDGKKVPQVYDGKFGNRYNLLGMNAMRPTVSDADNLMFFATNKSPYATHDDILKTETNTVSRMFILGKDGGVPADYQVLLEASGQSIAFQGLWDNPITGIYLAASPDGKTIYAAQKDKVLKVVHAASTVSVFLTGFSNINDIEIDGTGMIYILDQSTVKKYDSQGNSLGSQNIPRARNIAAAGDGQTLYFITGFNNEDKKLLKYDASFNLKYEITFNIQDEYKFGVPHFFPATDTVRFTSAGTPVIMSTSVGLALDENTGGDAVLWLSVGNYRSLGIIWRIVDNGNSFTNQYDVIRDLEPDLGLGQPWENVGIDMEREEIYIKQRIYDGFTGSFKRFFPPFDSVVGVWPWGKNDPGKSYLPRLISNQCHDFEIDGFRDVVYMHRPYSK
ncbi:MAG: hypothetical protein ABIA63_13570, partial [bacterium]